jgi:lantibiotic modifying enzyme
MVLLGLRAPFNDAATALAARIGEELLEAAEVDERGHRWRSPSRPDALPLTGLAHGASGVACALAELYAASGDNRFRAAALGEFDWERGWLERASGSWPDFRDLDQDATRRSTLPHSTFWCHGAPGIAVARLRAWRLLGDPRLLDDALLALESTRRWVEDELDNGANFSLCHGLAGNAEILSLGAAAIGAETAPLHDAALTVALAGIERHATHAHDWPCGTHAGQTPGLMLGLAGVGLFYLRLAQPRIRSVLLP